MVHWQREWAGAIADVLMNLSATWFALVLITPNIIDRPLPTIITTTLANVGLGVMALWIGVIIRKINNENTYD